FFFQAEDGIRDFHVTGVQTCALPISWRSVRLTLNGIYEYRTEEVGPGGHVMLTVNKFAIRDQIGKPTYAPRNLEPKTLLVDTLEIGRASCRERGKGAEDAVAAQREGE